MQHVRSYDEARENAFIISTLVQDRQAKNYAPNNIRNSISIREILYAYVATSVMEPPHVVLLPPKIDEHTLKYERNLNFSIVHPSMLDHTDDDTSFTSNMRRKSRDPLSHRIIEKRRRDRMNGCLADLARLIPSPYVNKKGRGRIEKTEIIEMAIKHIETLEQKTSKRHVDACDMSPDEASASSSEVLTASTIAMKYFRLGFQECAQEALRYLLQTEEMFDNEAAGVRLMNHLQQHCNSSAAKAWHPSEVIIDPVSSEDSHSVPLSVNHQSLLESESGGRLTPPCHVVTHGHGVDTEDSRSSCRSPFEIHDDNSNPCGQLRNILQASRGSSSSWLHHRSPYHRPTHSTTESDDPTGLKYKNSLQERYWEQSANAVSQLAEKRCDLNLHNSRTDSVIAHGNVKLRNRSNSASPRSRLVSSPTNRNPYHASDEPPVPIFALHSKGSYYIPLTIDADYMTPILHSWTTDRQTPSMHPVTINVAFCDPFRTVPRTVPSLDHRSAFHSVRIENRDEHDNYVERWTQ